MFDLLAPASFLRRAKKFFCKHSELKGKVAGLLVDLQKDPFQPHLKLYSLRGKLNGLYAVSITYSYRLTLTMEIQEESIVLIDIGSHDDVY